MTKERAYLLTMDEIMSGGGLRNQFDSMRVNHLSLLWRRIRVALQPLLVSLDYKVSWGCEEILSPILCLRATSPFRDGGASSKE